MGLNITATPTLGTLDDLIVQLKDAREKLIERGMKPEDIDFPINLQMYVDDNAEVAYEKTKEYFDWYFEIVGKIVPGASGDKAVKSYEEWEQVAKNLSATTFESLRQGGNIHVDGPQALIETIEKMQEAFGLKQLSCWMRVGGMSDKLVRSSMERLATDVIPYFKKKAAKVKS